MKNLSYILLLATLLVSCLEQSVAADSGKNGLFTVTLAPAKKDGKWGYINRKGEFVIHINPQFDHAWPFSERLTEVEIDGKKGHINQKGEFVITSNPQFDFAGAFSKGWARVDISYDWVINNAGGTKTFTFPLMKHAYINQKGNFVINPPYDPDTGSIYNTVVSGISIPPAAYMWFFDGKPKPESFQGKWGFINSKGEVIININPYVDYAWPFLAWSFSEGWVRVRIGDKAGYINRKGEVVIDPQFDFAWPFSEGLAQKKKDGKWGYINREGEFVIDPQFDFAWPFFNMIFSRSDGKWKHITQMGGITWKVVDFINP